MEYFNLEGLIAAPVTPFHHNGELNLSIIGEYIDMLLSQGIKQIYLNGYTGEGPSMTVNERKQVAEKWINEANGKLGKIIVQIGGTNMKDSQELAIHAKSIKASAIASLPPLLYQSDMAGLVEYCRELTAVVPDMPFIYYHIPSKTNVHVNIEEFLEASKDKLPSLVGVKFSHNDLLEVSRCLFVADGKFQISIGVDESLLSALSIGVTSAIGSTYNYSGKLNCSIIEAFKKGDMEKARKLQRKLRDFIEILIKYGGDTGVCKAILGLIGLNAGPPRLPTMALDQEKIAALKEDLNDAGFFD